MASRKLKTTGQPRQDATAGTAPAHSKASKNPGDGHTVSDQDRTTVMPPAEMTAEDAATRELMIAQAAYYRAQLRDFSPGAELQDWLEAEQEIDGARQASWTV